MELGAAWTKKARSGREYLVVTHDDPAFVKPIQARIVRAASGYSLIWNWG